MIAASKRWLRRNRTNFAIGLGVLSASYLVGQYVISKIQEMRERANNERIARENLRRRFVQNQEDCTYTVLALLPTVRENVLEALPVENITNELQQQRAEKLGRSAGASELTPSELSSSTPSVGDDGKSIGSTSGESYVHASQMGASILDGSGDMVRAKKSKAQLWDELKISAITRSFTLIYTLALLTIFTRIQLNLLGRRSYVSSVFSLASPQRNDSTISLESHENRDADFETNRNFLAFSWWLLHRGWRDLRNRAEAAVKEVFGSTSPREEVTFQRFSELIIETRKKVEGATEEERRTMKWLPCLLPPIGQEEYVLRESGVLPSSSSSANSPSISDPGISLGGPPEPRGQENSSATFTTQATEPIPSSSTQSQSQHPSTIPPPLQHLLNETSDLLDAPQTTRVTTLLLDALFSRLTDTAIRTQAFKAAPPPPPESSSANLNHPIEEIFEGEPQPPEPALLKAKLATILAVVTRQAHAIGSDVPNVYVQATEGVKELEALAAVIYAARDENLAGRSMGAGAGAVAGALAPENHVLEPGAQTRDGGRTDGGGGGEGIVGATWGMFESVWGRVTGR